MEKKELIELFEQFLNEHGQWYSFKDWVEDQGYTIEELGFTDEG